MKQEEYVRSDVEGFRDWLATALCGEPVRFSVPGHRAEYQTLRQALDAYRWPLRAVSGLSNLKDGCPFVHPEVNALPAMSSLADNAEVLNTLQVALRAAYDEGPNASGHLAGAAAAVFHWGGVYTTTLHGGNKPWLAANHLSLHSILQTVVKDHATGDDLSKVANLRFNSGMTKVYSLLIDDFIIYDSRVAAALAWLISRWWATTLGREASKLPLSLRIGCLAANGNAAAFRNPDSSVFRTLSNRPYEHYQWNVRANWILGSAQQKAGKRSQFKNLREIEAALFQMGERVV